MRYEIVGLLFLLALFVGGWVFPLAVGFDDWRAGLTFPMGIMGTMFVPFVIRDVLRSHRDDD